METVAAKVPDDLVQEIENYQEAHGLNKSQAIRRLVEDGLEADRLRDDLEERRAKDERTIAVTKPAVVSLLGWFLVVADWVTVTAGQPVGWVGVAIIVASAAYAAVRGHL